MMGRSHALTGLAAGIYGAYAANVPVPAGIAGAILCTGAAILPDIDHHRSTVSNMYGPVTRVFSWTINKLTGGHRRGTHSVPGILGLAIVAQAGVVYRHEWYGQVPISLIMILCLGGAIRLLKIPGWWDDFVPFPIVAGIVFLTDVPLGIVPVAVALGCMIHVAGDMVTKQGCPIMWPLSDKKTALALFKTNGRIERWIVVPLTVALILGELGWIVYQGVDGFR